MGIVMSYSSIAAIHAMILVAGRKTMTSAGIEMISVSKTNDITIPIYPQVWDEDTDAVLAITGTAFLAIAPLALWSDTIQQILQRKPLTAPNELDSEEPFQSNPQPVLRAQWKKRLVLITWFFLLLIGNICAWVNEIYVDTHSVEQFRICITEEKLPDLMSHSSLNHLGGKIAGKSLNETLWDMVTDSATAQSKIPICVYPCFSAPGHRQDARAIPSKGTWPSISNYSNPRPGWALMLVSMVLIGTSLAFIITIFILQQTGRVKYGRTDDDRAEDTIQIKFAHWPWFERSAKGLAIASFGLFIAWIEYILWPFPYSEGFKEVGQWGAVMSLVLVLAYAAFEDWKALIEGVSHWAERRYVNFQHAVAFVRRSQRNQ
jgi:hypothetical protein